MGRQGLQVQVGQIAPAQYRRAPWPAIHYAIATTGRAGIIDYMLNRLLAGTVAGDGGETATLLRDLQSRLIHLEVAAARLRAGLASARDVTLYGPYIGRAYLETATTTLLARMDPFRVLAAKRHQEADYYQAGERSKSAVQWSGDIVSPIKPTKHLWSVDTREVGCRSLLGAWAEEIVWIPAFEQFGDAVAASGPMDDWITDLSKKSVDQFCKELRSSLEGLFSKFSKGVHSELLGQRAAMFDSISIESDFRSAAQRITCLALLSHFSEHFAFRLEGKRAMGIADRIGRHWK